MKFGEKTLTRGDKGPEVTELQLRLSGFRGTTWDGGFGPGTELQVIAFQRDYMGINDPSGIVDASTFQAIKRFAEEFPIDFKKLNCACGKCKGFGNGRYKGEYRAGKARTERTHKYEYPGIHKAILHAFRAAQFYAVRAGFDRPFFTCGYRCWINNQQRGRQSTNHMGKAIDIDLPMRPGDDKKDDRNRCDAVRAVLVEKCNFQTGWGAANQKALEPSHIAPTWVHMDVRCYASKYLADAFFIKKPEELDKALSIVVADPAPIRAPSAAPTGGQGGTAVEKSPSSSDIASLISSLNLP